MRLNLREMACGVDCSHPTTVQFNCTDFNYNATYSFTWLYVCEMNKK